MRNKSRPPKPEKDNSDKEKAEKPDKGKSAGDKDKPANDKEKAQLKKPEYEAQLKTLIDLFNAQPPPDKRKPVTRGKHSYYDLPPSYSTSKTFCDKLRAEKRCTNCGDCDQHFPRHTARNCPYVSRFPAWIPSDEFAPVLPLQTPRTLNGFPVEFREPAPYRGTVTKINRGISDAERGELHIFSGLLTPNPALALPALVRRSRPVASAAPAACESSPAIPASTDSVMLSPAPDRPCEVTNSPHLLERFRASNRLQSGSPPKSLTWLSLWFRWVLCLITMLLVWISFPLPHAPSFAVNDVARSVSRTLNSYPNAMKFSPAVDSVQAEIFLGFTNDGNAIRIGVDSYCEGTLISSSVVKSDMIILFCSCTYSAILDLS